MKALYSLFVALGMLLLSVKAANPPMEQPPKSPLPSLRPYRSSASGKRSQNPLTPRVTELEKSLDTVTKGIVGLEQAVNQCNTELAALEQAANQCNTELAALKGQIDDLRATTDKQAKELATQSRITVFTIGGIMAIIATGALVGAYFVFGTKLRSSTSFLS